MTNTARTVKVKIADVRIDGGTQPRARLDQGVIDEYSECIDQMPPGQAVYDGICYWLWNGHHRYFAHKKLNRDEIVLSVTEGTQRDAILLSLSANADNGLRRSAEDKRKAVSIMLADPEWQQFSSRKIAEACRVSHKFVNDLRNERGLDEDGNPKGTFDAHLEPSPDAPAGSTPAPDIDVPEDVADDVEQIQQSGGTARIVERTNPKTGEKQVYAQDTSNVGKPLPVDVRRKVLSGAKSLDADRAESLAQATKGLTMKQMKAVTASINAGEPVEEVMDRYKADPEEPWKQFNEAMKDVIADVRAASRKLADVLEVDTEKKQIRNKWGHFYHYMGTVGFLNQLARELESGMPCRKHPDKPGFITKKMAAIKDHKPAA